MTERVIGGRRDRNLVRIVHEKLVLAVCGLDQSGRFFAELELGAVSKGSGRKIAPDGGADVDVGVIKAHLRPGVEVMND